MTTSAGRRGTRIRFERAAKEADGDGFENLTWAVLEGAWAQVNFGRGDERRGASRENVAVPATFRVLTTAKVRGLTAEDRLVTESDGKVWDITSVVPFGRGEFDITALWSA